MHGFLGISPEEYAKASRLAGEILAQAQNTLRMHLRFLDGAMNRLGAAIHNEIVFATNGQTLFYPLC